MSTISIDLESLGLTLTKGVTYRIELDEGFVKATDSGIANAENTIISFVAKGPEITSTVLDNDDFHVTSTWNVKLSALGTGNESDEYFAADYIASNYFSDLVPVATLYQDDSTFVKQYPVSKISDTQTRITIPSVDLRPGTSYFLYYEEDTVIDTVQMGNDTVNTDTTTTFTTQTEAEGFPSLTASVSSSTGLSCDAGKNVFVTGEVATVDASADLSADSRSVVIFESSISSSTGLSCDADKILGEILFETQSSTSNFNSDMERLRNADTVLISSASLTCEPYRIPGPTYIIYDIDEFMEPDLNHFYARITCTNVSPGSTIDWGDGSTTNTVEGSNFHIYTSLGEYQVTIDGTVRNIDLTYSYALFDSADFVTTVWPGKTLHGIKIRGKNCTFVGDVVGASMNTFEQMFDGCESLNQDLSEWDVSNITNMDYCFRRCARLTYQDFNSWDVSNVTSMVGMFMHFDRTYDVDDGYIIRKEINLKINDWDVSNVTDMSNMFRETHVGQYFATQVSVDLQLGDWDTSSVQYMTEMFRGCRLKRQGSQYLQGTLGNINNWDTSSVEGMTGMFERSDFDDDISNWDTSNVVSMTRMFKLNDDFDQDISSWCVELISQKPDEFDYLTTSDWTEAEKPNWGAACS